MITDIHFIKQLTQQRKYAEACSLAFELIHNVKPSDIRKPAHYFENSIKANEKLW